MLFSAFRFPPNLQHKLNDPCTGKYELNHILVYISEI